MLHLSDTVILEKLGHTPSTVHLSDPSNEMLLILWITHEELDILILLAWIKVHHNLSDSDT
jgi:hypothetical protein